MHARTRTGVVVLLCLIALAAGAALAGAAAYTTSANWAGYAIHGHGERFSRVTGIWTVPQARCAAGHPAYSATWVGIGGYNLNAHALEQIGTETDCRRDGSAHSSAWWELVPTPSRHAALAVHAGDLMQGVVTVHGDVVTLILRDLTTRRAFVKRMVDRSPDVTSAEWIVEAPSNCAASSHCRTLPLADFGREVFTHATVTPFSGRPGTIADRRWGITRIALRPQTGGQAGAAGAPPSIRAVTSGLKGSGGAFEVAFTA